MTHRPYTLFNETPGFYDRHIARVLGLQEAVLLQEIHFRTNPSHNTHFKDDHYWVYNTLDDWAKTIDFCSPATIRRMIAKLEDMKIIVSCKPYAHLRDHKKWYRIDYEKLDEVLRSDARYAQNEKIEESEDLQGESENPDMLKMSKSDMLKMSKSYIEANNTTSNKGNNNNARAREETPTLKQGEYDPVRLEQVKRVFGAFETYYPDLLTNTSLHHLINQWIDEGADVDKDIIATIIATSQKPIDVRTPRYFSPGILSSMRNRSMPAFEKNGKRKEKEQKLDPKVIEEQVAANFEKAIEGTDGTWREVSLSLQKRIGQAAYSSWFGQTDASIEGSTCIIRAPNAFVRDTVDNKFKDDIFAACQALKLPIREVEVRV